MTARDGIVLGMPDDEYHSGPELSSTGAKLLLKAPATFRHYIENERAPKTVFDVGHAAHAKVLGVGAGVVEYPAEHLTPSGNVSTKAATLEWAATQRALGLTPISPDEAGRVHAMSEAILAHPAAKALLEQEGDPEVSLFATDPETGVRLRARYDYRAAIAADLKTTAGSASPTEFARSVFRLGYDVQDSHYRYTDQLICGADRPMVFIVVEKDAPHLVGVHQLDRDFIEMGAAKAARARHLFAQASTTGVWGGYPTEITLTTPPMYAIYDYQDNYS